MQILTRREVLVSWNPEKERIKIIKDNNVELSREEAGEYFAVTAISMLNHEKLLNNDDYLICYGDGSPINCDHIFKNNTNTEVKQ